MITSLANARVKAIRLLQSRRSARADQGRYVIEGNRLVQEAVDANVDVELVLHAVEPDPGLLTLLDSLSRLGAETIAASDDVLAACSDTESPQGVIAVVPTPPAPKPIAAEPLLIVDRMRDPGNMGTLMRSALAAGVELLVLMPGTVDVLNPKVVRGAMGAHFHLPFKALDDPDELGPYLNGLTLWVAEAEKGVRYDRVDWTRPSALVIGNEAHGPSQSVLAWEHGHVHIPIKAASESLNAAVAGSILLFEISRQRGEQ